MGKNKQRLTNHNSDLSAILDEINNLPPAGSEDLQSTAEAQTEAVNELLSLVKRKVADKRGVIAIVDGERYSEDFELSGYDGLTVEVSEIPYEYRRGAAVVFNNEIHILGNSLNANTRNHYKWDGSNWTSVSTLPDDLVGNAVVWRNEIHFVGGTSRRDHYKWDGTEWTKVSTANVYLNYGGSVIVYRDELHIFGSDSDGNNRKLHSKWNGESWVKASTLPVSFLYGTSLVLNDELHILGGSAVDSNRAHYKWDGTEWTNVSTLPYPLNHGTAILLDNEIHITGGENVNSTVYGVNHYRWDGSTWIKERELSDNFSNHSTVVFDGEMHLLGGSSTRRKHAVCTRLYRKLGGEFSHLAFERSGQYLWHQLTAENGDFVAYVTADDPDAYPNGAEQDGYWYEFVGDGTS